jgi:SAM-dependent methyltransferase
LVNENICVDWENTLHVNPFLDETADLSRELPFPSSSFDTVLMTDVLEHLPDPVSAINQVARVLRPGGKLILGVPFFYWLHERPHDYYRYTEYALRRFCDIAGLRIVELWPYGGLPEVLVDLISKGLCGLPRWLEKPLRPLNLVAVTLASSFLHRKVSNPRKDLFPLGYVMIAEKPNG